MSAMFNKKLVHLLNRITGLVIKPESMFWSDAISFSCCSINMNVSCTVYKIKVIKEELKKYLSGNDNSKAIVYSNVSSQITIM